MPDSIESTMSDQPTLYRIANPTDIGQHEANAQTVEWLKSIGVLVPVEPCEHGKIDGHWWPKHPELPPKTGRWCPGAGIGEENAAMEDLKRVEADPHFDTSTGPWSEIGDNDA